MGFFKKYIHFFLLNYVLVFIYFLFFNSLHIDINGGILFTTVDAFTYLATSEEFYKLSESGYSIIRPFLYPLIVLLVYKPFGATALWLLHVLFWFCAINFIFDSVKRITGKIVLSYLSALIMAVNFSYFGLTLQCLTEVTTILLVSILVFFVVKNAVKADTLNFFHGSLFILTLLTVLKPVFFIPTVGMLLIVLPVFYFKKYKQTPKRIFTLILVLFPLLFQMGMMKIKYDSFTVSKISSETFRNYILAQGAAEIQHFTIQQAREKTTHFSSAEVIDYISDNKVLYFSIYCQNLDYNMNAFSSFLLGPRQYMYPEYVSYMRVINSICYWLHILFIIPVLAALWLLRKQKLRRNYFIVLMYCLTLCYYIFLTSPVSFGEGDRLIITALPLWIVMYAMAFNFFANYWKYKSSGVILDASKI